MNRPGSSITWSTKNREMNAVVGNCPPKASDATYGPTNGIESVAE